MNKKNAISVIASKSTSCASLRGREKKLSVASFFAGVGGIELGFEQTGAFKTIYANEYDPYPIATYELNSRIHVDTRSICEVKPEDVPDTDIIAAGFPCTDLSIAGNRTGLRNEDGSLTRSGLFYELTRIIQAKAPRVVMLENVQHLEHHDDGKTLQAVLDELRKAGYQYVHYDVLSGDTHGDIPQNRERIFIVGFQFEEDFRRFSFPEPVLLKKSVFDVIDSKSVKDEKYYYREWKGNGKAYQILRNPDHLI